MNRSVAKLARILLTCAMSVACALAFASQDNDPVVVVNPQVEETAISLSTIRTVFGMRLRTWKDGTLIKVYVLSDDHQLHAGFSKQVFEIQKLG